MLALLYIIKSAALSNLNHLLITSLWILNDENRFQNNYFPNPYFYSLFFFSIHVFFLMIFSQTLALIKKSFFSEKIIFSLCFYVKYNKNKLSNLIIVCSNFINLRKAKMLYMFSKIILRSAGCVWILVFGYHYFQMIRFA